LIDCDDVGNSILCRIPRLSDQSCRSRYCCRGW